MDPSPRPLWGEGGEPVRHSAANGPERSEGAQGKLREPGEGAGHFRSAHETSGPKFPDRAALVIRIIPLTTETPTLKRNGVLCVSVPLWWAVRGSEVSGREPLGGKRRSYAQPVRS
jgi:hypothetical protein